jgi:glyoxylase-like metal-dependent hydrolase (beta-lactamase superfamily II)
VLAEALRSIGTGMDRVHGVLVTHHHRDHSGLVSRVVAESGAYVAMHRADAAILGDGSWFVDRIDASELGADGVPDAVIEAIKGASAERFPPMEPVPGIRYIDDEQLVEIPGWQVRGVWTPGHTPGHMCFAVQLAGRELLLSGDHLLPRITPNVGLTSRSNANPLLDYRSSLAKVLRATPDAEVLPAHEWRFNELAARIEEIEAHHELRLTELEALLASGPMTPWQVAASLTWKRPWEDLDELARYSALNEARAHLAFLVGNGVLTSRGTSPTRYEVV